MVVTVPRTARATLITACLLAAGANPAAAATNLALTGTATQSSTYRGEGVASRAIDGNTEGSWWLGSVSHTDEETNPWWQVRLAADAHIDTVVLWNRTDCCGERLSNLWLTLWNDGQQVASQWVATGPAPTASFQFGGLVADTVRLQRVVSSGYLQAAEVQVFGEVTAVPEPQTWALMAGGLAGLVAWARRRAAR